jgi:hypothetical protein
LGEYHEVSSPHFEPKSRCVKTKVIADETGMSSIGAVFDVFCEILASIRGLVLAQGVELLGFSIISAVIIISYWPL